MTATKPVVAQSAVQSSAVHDNCVKRPADKLRADHRVHGTPLENPPRIHTNPRTDPALDRWRTSSLLMRLIRCDRMQTRRSISRTDLSWDLLLAAASLPKQTNGKVHVLGHPQPKFNLEHVVKRPAVNGLPPACEPPACEPPTCKVPSYPVHPASCVGNR